MTKGQNWYEGLWRVKVDPNMQGLEGTHCSPSDLPVRLLWKSTENPKQQPKKGERDKIEAEWMN